ncbi:MAG: CBS domain-containing protein [Candidatus Hydrothermarchaeaceae archaeon]
MALNDLKARDVMITKLLTISPSEKIALADLTMIRNSVGGLPVVDGEKPVGIITQRDLLLARNYEVGGLTAEDFMTKELITASPDASLKDILKLMLDNKIERIPVVEEGKLVGLVVHGKILKSLYDSL